MAETLKLAVPTMGKAGLNAQRSGHFGHCDCFTLVDIVNGELIAAAGMGMRPMQGFANAGIAVYYDAEHPIVGDAAKLVAEGKLPNMTADQACQH